MTMFLVTPPEIEPVTIEDARAFLRLSSTSEDAILERLIRTARELVEVETGLALIDQTWRLRVDRWPRSGRLALFKFPVTSIAMVVAYRPDGTAISFPPEEFHLQDGRRPQRLYMASYPEAMSLCGLEVDFVAGFGATAASVPEVLKQAIFNLTAHLYETRAGIDAVATPLTIPPMVNQLVESWRRIPL
ncbi:phage head-tail connector protein [Brucella sp. BE17]|uniref:head-tail connector protein n=1 Tax=Brucella sp. BE17 TaxID=3142977 RepID=UPI0031B9C0CD